MLIECRQQTYSSALSLAYISSKRQNTSDLLISASVEKSEKSSPTFQDKRKMNTIKRNTAFLHIKSERCLHWNALGGEWRAIVLVQIWQILVHVTVQNDGALALYCKRD